MNNTIDSAQQPDPWCVKDASPRSPGQMSNFSETADLVTGEGHAAQSGGRGFFATSPTMVPGA